MARAKAACAKPALSCRPTGKQPRIRPMGEYVHLLKAMADENRLGILTLLAQKGAPMCVNDIEAHFQISQPTISHHLRVLREANLVTSERNGLWVYYALDRSTIDMLGEFCLLITR